MSHLQLDGWQQCLIKCWQRGDSPTSAPQVATSCDGHLQTIQGSLADGRDCAYKYLHTPLTEARISVHAFSSPAMCKASKAHWSDYRESDRCQQWLDSLSQTTENPVFEQTEAGPRGRARLIGLGISSPQYLFIPVINDMLLRI